ncbi:MAG TPA: Uma2 family endonuclease [Blastocatellia bacterium]|nr:Uma2 family endonuclease [Blastocatellia bacterium]
MAIRKSPQLYTIEQYLAIERRSEERYEYLDGEIFAMAGESIAHGDICTSLGGFLHSQLRGTPCRVLVKDTKVRSGPNPPPRSTKGLFSYPDLVVICGKVQFHDEHQDVVLNPIVIIEVLSESTESFDRGEKFLRYQEWSPTLSDYLLVWQTRPAIEHFIRQPNGSWSYHLYSGLDQKLIINSINCELRLAEVYERVVFPSEETDEEEA